MPNRTARRAAEHAARKAERTTQPAQLPVTGVPKTLAAAASAYMPDCPVTPTETSPARIVANRINALKATGPRTPEGCAKSALNALKHGLTGNTVLLDSDDAEPYQQRLDAYVQQYGPITLEERRLVQSLHDADWRLDRILNLESTIYAKARVEMAGPFEELPENQRQSFIQLETYDRNEKKLRNLALQEGRIQRQRAKDLAALKQLIAARKAEAQAVAELAAKTQSALATRVGFEFSNAEIGSPATEKTAAERLE
jgi:hypothetical protein